MLRSLCLSPRCSPCCRPKTPCPTSSSGTAAATVVWMLQSCSCSWGPSRWKVRPLPSPCGAWRCPTRYPGPCGAWQCVSDVDIYHEWHGNVSHTLPQGPVGYGNCVPYVTLGPLGRGDVHLPNRNVLLCQTSHSLVCAFVKQKFLPLSDQ